MSRKYTKKSDYWIKRNNPLLAPNAPQPIVVKQQEAEEIHAGAMVGDNAFSATASCGGGNVNPLGARDGYTGSILEVNKYPNIRNGLVPLTELQGNYTVSEAISTTYLAYHNF